MKNKQKYITQGSFALLFFIILGYAVRFYPQQLSTLDSDFQTWVRGDLQDPLKTFFRLITILGNSPVIIAYTALLASFFYWFKKWQSEALFLIGNLLGLGVFSTLFKFMYNRPRPSLEYLIEKPIGASFPSWHAAATMMVALSLAVIVQQRMKTPGLKKIVQGLLVVLAVTIGMSRIYLGVHYPTDILAGWLLTIAIISCVYPFYDQKRFEWRFTRKQR